MSTADKGATPKPMRIDLRAILKSRRAPIPAPVVRMLERVIRQEELNGILSRTFPAEGSKFAAAALRDLDVTLSTSGLESLSPDKRYIFASNHPLGGLDGVALVDVLGSKFGDDNIRFLVNDILLNIKPLAPVFLPINKYGTQGREAARRINDTYASDKQILIFPAGLVSRLHPDGEIRDLKWQKAFVAKALEYGRDIVPVRFIGQNSNRFYNTALWRKRLGMKLNIEQILLPSELTGARGAHYRIIFGNPIPCEKIRSYGDRPELIAEAVKRIVYSLH